MSSSSSGSSSANGNGEQHQQPIPVLAPADVQHAISLIEAAYAPSAAADLSQLQSLQSALLAMQRTPAAWGLVVPLLAQEDANVQFFGAHTAHAKIARATAGAICAQGSAGGIGGRAVREGGAEEAIPWPHPTSHCPTSTSVKMCAGGSCESLSVFLLVELLAATRPADLSFRFASTDWLIRGVSARCGDRHVNAYKIVRADMLVSLVSEATPELEGWRVSSLGDCRHLCAPPTMRQTPPSIADTGVRRVRWRGGGDAPRDAGTEGGDGKGCAETLDAPRGSLTPSRRYLPGDGLIHPYHSEAHMWRARGARARPKPPPRTPRSRALERLFDAVLRRRLNATGQRSVGRRGDCGRSTEGWRDRRKGEVLEVARLTESGLVGKFSSLHTQVARCTSQDTLAAAGAQPVLSPRYRSAPYPAEDLCLCVRRLRRRVKKEIGFPFLDTGFGGFGFRPSGPERVGARAGEGGGRAVHVISERNFTRGFGALAAVCTGTGCVLQRQRPSAARFGGALKRARCRRQQGRPESDTWSGDANVGQHTEIKRARGCGCEHKGLSGTEHRSLVKLCARCPFLSHSPSAR
ncbi:hypothetical protein DFH06DRAFT_1148413 [Mycena polygramma]|nr:hypothetical protein DFH06DRAFT_1148413 [Mycena polygramma]